MTLRTVTDQVAAGLASRTSRRGFLVRSALAGSAVAVSPVGFTLRPGTAYAAICGCNGSNCDCASACCDGYTEFCCTVSGENTCPPGTVAAGWWKVDGSRFCGGGARYYIDCNSQCGGCSCGSSGVCSPSCSGARCSCAAGSCNHRKTQCTSFRYGQCHREIACVGQIVCRVVSCVAPWQIDPSCSATVAVDRRTESHDGPCLHSAVGEMEVSQTSGGGTRVTGWALDPARAGAVDVILRGGGGVTTRVRADRPHHDVARRYPGHGPNHGFDATLPVSSGQVCGRAVIPGEPSSDSEIGCIAAGPRRGLGYWLLERNGVLHGFGEAANVLAGVPKVPLGIGAAAVDTVSVLGGAGLLVVDSTGRIHRFGQAPFHGDAAGRPLAAGERITTLAARQDGSGYWIFTSRGRAFAFGAAPFRGDMSNVNLIGPVVDATATPDGNGYYMCAADGGIFTFGSARFEGSLPQIIRYDRLVRPVVGMVANPAGRGYWLVAADGGIFSFGAPFRGSLPPLVPVHLLQGLVTTALPWGNGYVLVATDGGVFVFSDRPFLGSAANSRRTSPIVAATVFEPRITS